jgi:hypothetical protein
MVPDDERSGETQAVQFRHADGNVLASVLQVLNEPQFARLFGPALALTFHTPDFRFQDSRNFYVNIKPALAKGWLPATPPS